MENFTTLCRRIPSIVSANLHLAPHRLAAIARGKKTKSPERVSLHALKLISPKTATSGRTSLVIIALWDKIGAKVYQRVWLNGETMLCQNLINSSSLICSCLLHNKPKIHNKSSKAKHMITTKAAHHELRKMKLQSLFFILQVDKSHADWEWNYFRTLNTRSRWLAFHFNLIWLVVNANLKLINICHLDVSNSLVGIQNESYEELRATKRIDWSHSSREEMKKRFTFGFQHMIVPWKQMNHIGSCFAFYESFLSIPDLFIWMDFLRFLRNQLWCQLRDPASYVTYHSIRLLSDNFFLSLNCICAGDNLRGN